MSQTSTYSKAGMLLTRSNLTNNMYFELFTSVATGYNNAKKLLDREYLLHDSISSTRGKGVKASQKSEGTLLLSIDLNKKVNDI